MKLVVLCCRSFCCAVVLCVVLFVLVCCVFFFLFLLFGFFLVFGFLFLVFYFCLLFSSFALPSFPLSSYYFVLDLLCRGFVWLCWTHITYVTHVRTRTYWYVTCVYYVCMVLLFVLLSLLSVFSSQWFQCLWLVARPFRFSVSLSAFPRMFGSFFFVVLFCFLVLT